MEIKDRQHSSLFSNLFTPSVLMRAAILFYGLFTWLAAGLPFFGDHVTLVSAPATFYFDDHFHHLLLPADLATGHPPLYGMLLAAFWTVFGRTLLVAHCFTLISMLLLLTQFQLLVKKWVPDHAVTALLLFLFHPVIIAQMAAMSSDILLTALFLSSLNGILSQNTKKTVLSAALMLLISLRGWVFLPVLVLANIMTGERTFTSMLRIAIRFCLAAIPCIVYFILQYRSEGWWLLPENGNWSAQRAFSQGIYIGGKGFELVVRLLEFGMMVPIGLLVWGVFKKKQRFKDIAFRIAVLAFIAIGFFTIPFTNPILIRYLLPVELLLILACIRISWPLIAGRWRKRWLVLMVLCFASQHFWAYPQMSRSLFEYSWGDGSLAHLSYFESRMKGRQWVEEHHIDPKSVFTAFPEYRSFDLTNLNGDKSYYSTLDIQQMDSVPYVIYSNIMNQIPKATEQTLEEHWKVMASWKAYPVEYTIYKNPVLP